MEKSREVFWTGGWDSTFRLIQLARYFNGSIQPVYILDDARKSYKKEIETMNEISRLLTERDDINACILPLKIVDKNEIPANDEVTEAYNKIKEKIAIGAQYEFLARYAAQNPYVEIGPERPNGEFSGIVEAIEAYGKLVEFGEDSWALSPEESTKECMLLFGNYSYPIIKTTEHEMRDMIIEWGFKDIMSHIWFCHNPINGSPCGICRPCEQKMDQHMEFLLPPKAQKRYKVYRFCTRRFGKFGEKCARKLLRYI